MQSFRRSALALAAITSLMSCPLSSQAQTAAATANAANANEETVVTISAQRRLEEIQKVPLSITALSSKEMQTLQIRRLDDLKLVVPNVVIEQNTGTSSGAKIFMRGVGTDESLFTADPSVAIYIDDMYVARQTGAMFDMFDLQRIEVLRGPQGTLYGRNATGGAIRYITKKPSGESRLEVDTRIGNFGRIDGSLSGSASLGGAAGGSVAVSFGLMTKSRGGYLQDITNNRLVNTEAVDGARVALAASLGASTSLRLSIDTLRQNSGPTYATGIVDQNTVVGTFIGGAEFQIQNGSLSNDNFVRLVYRQILLREAAPAEVTFQSGTLGGGTTRIQLASNFLNSTEFRITTGPRLTAFLMYACLLQRDPGASERTSMINQVKASTPVRTLVDGIIGATEFQGIVN